MKLREKFRQKMLPLNEMNWILPIEGLIYEIGCGNGVICRYLKSQAAGRQLIGLENSLTKYRLIQKFRSQEVKYILADAVTFNYQKCSGAVMSDFLHHLNFANQQKILIRVSKALNNRGILIIKEIDRNDGILMFLSRLWDFLLYPQDKIYYRSKADWIKLLSGLNLNVVHRRAVKWFPGSTHLFICQKL